MADDLLIRIDASTTGYESAIARAERQTHSFEYALRDLERRARAAEVASADAARQLEVRTARQAAAIEATGRAMVTAGAGVGLGLALSAKAAIDWESAWTGVRKVIKGTPAEMAQLERGLRDLTKILPSSHEELAGIAEAAGQLGIKTPNILAFTKTVAELAQTTNLTADDAAASMARFANIMKTPQSQVENLGSSLVALGNAGASTESDILEMGKRIAGAGQVIGLSEGDTLGFANALSSLGVEAEAGGTAISMTFRQMAESVAQGGDELDGFADVAGVSGEEFTQMFGHDAAGASVAFVEGLKDIRDSGGDVFTTLENLHITGSRQVDTLLRLSGNTDLLTKSLELGNKAYKDNSALTAEFGQRNDTTAAKLEHARNAVHDLAIDLGNFLLPAIGKVAEGASDLGDFFSDLPEPVKATATVLASGAAAVGLLGGAALLAAGKVASLKQRVADLEGTGSGLTRNMLAARAGTAALGAGLAALNAHVDDSHQAMKGLLSTASGAAMGFAAGGPWGAAVGAGAGLLTSFAEANAAAAADVDALTATLNQQTGAITDNSMEWAASKLADAGTIDDIAKLGLSASDVTQAMLGNSDAFAKVNAVLDSYIDSTKKSVSTTGYSSDQFNSTAQAAEKLKDVIGDANGTLSTAQQKQDFLAAASGRATAAMLKQMHGYQGGGYAIDDYGNKVDLTTRALHGQKDAVDDTKKSLEGYRTVAASLISKQLGLSQAIIDSRNALDDNADGFNKNTQEGIDNYNVVLRIAEATDGMKASTDKGRESIERARQAIIDYATAQGMAIPEAQKLAERLLGVRDAGKAVNDQPANMRVTADTDQAKRDIDSFRSYTNSQLHQIHDEAINFTMTAQAAKIASQLGTVHAATGGAIHGPGTGTSDSIAARLSNNEHVVENAAVYGAGGGDYTRGHRVWEQLRYLARRGRLGRMGDLGLPGFAEGGAVRVSPDVSARGFAAAAARVQAYYDAIAAQMSASLSKRGNDYLTELPPPGGSISGLGSAGSLQPAEIVRGQNFAKTQSGMPYQWGGIGNPSWDCSGFVGGVLLAAKGLNPHQRIGTTASMPWSGFSRGTGTFTVGNDPGSHMAGAIGGMGIESNGYYGVKAGPLNTPLGTFADLWKYDQGGLLPPGVHAVFNGTGKNETVRTFDQEKQLAGLTEEQQRMARTIISVGQSMDMSVRDIRIAIMTALQESTLRNLNYGDRDSIGLFQQRPSQGWGTQAQIMDPQYSSRKFYEALRGIADRENMTMAQAAQAVQRSADGSLYIDDRVHATNIVKSLLGSGDGAGGRGGTHGQDARAASQEAHQAAREQAQQERELARSVEHFRITARESASDVHQQAAELIAGLRETFGGKSPIVDKMAGLGTQMVEAARERDKVTASLSKAVDRLDSLESKRHDLVSSTADSFTADVFGTASAQTVQGMRAYLRDELAHTQAFGVAEDRLIRKGLSRDLIAQLVGTGPDALHKAQALSRLSRDELASFQHLVERQADAAHDVGVAAGDALYANGIKAADGIVDGLREHRAQITRELTHLATVAVRTVTAGLGHVGSGGRDGGGHHQHLPQSHRNVGTFGPNAGRSHGGGHGRRHAGADRGIASGDGVSVNLNGSIHTHDVHAAAREILRAQRQALAKAVSP